LIGQPFTATFTVANNCAPCNGGRDPFAIYPNPVNPILDATLTINGHTYDFNGPISVGSIVHNSVDPSQYEFDITVWTPHTSVAPNGFVSTSYSRADLQNAGFFIDTGFAPCCTEGRFNIPGAQGVPGPILGSGLPGLILAGVLLYRALRQRAQCA